MKLNFSNGEMWYVKSVSEAKNMICSWAGNRCVYKDDKNGRILAWECRKDAENDDGQAAIAEIIYKENCHNTLE